MHKKEVLYWGSGLSSHRSSIGLREWEPVFLGSCTASITATWPLCQRWEDQWKGLAENNWPKHCIYLCLVLIPWFMFPGKSEHLIKKKKTVTLFFPPHRSIHMPLPQTSLQDYSLLSPQLPSPSSTSKPLTAQESMCILNSGCFSFHVKWVTKALLTEFSLTSAFQGYPK